MPAPVDAQAPPLGGVHHDDVRNAADDQQIPRERAHQREQRPGHRVRRERQQQHDRRDVGHDVAQYERRHEQRTRLLEVEAGVCERPHRLGRQARLRERAVDDEEADEEHEQFPVHESEHPARVQAAAQEQQPGARKRRELPWPRRGEKDHDEDGRHGEPLCRLPAVEVRILPTPLQPSLRGQERRRAVPAAADLEHDQRPGHGQPKQHRHCRLAQIAAEGQPQRLADEHVLRIADECEG